MVPKVLANSNGDFSTSLYYKGNRDITWETSHSFNTGFDFTFWDGKLSGSVDEVKQEAAHKEAPKVRDDKAR